MVRSACDKDDEVGDVLGLQRLVALVDRLRTVRVSVEPDLGELGLHQSRIDTADPDLRSQQVKGHSLVQGPDGELAGVVDGTLLLDLVAGNAADVHDVP